MPKFVPKLMLLGLLGAIIATNASAASVADSDLNEMIVYKVGMETASAWASTCHAHHGYYVHHVIETATTLELTMSCTGAPDIAATDVVRLRSEKHRIAITLPAARLQEGRWGFVANLHAIRGDCQLERDASGTVVSAICTELPAKAQASLD